MEATQSNRLEESHVDLASRLSARAILAGVFLALASMRVLMALGGGLGLWRFRPGMTPHDFGVGFWVCAFIAWAVSLFFGGLLAAIAGRCRLRRDGIVQGVTTWAVATVVARIAVVLVSRILGFAPITSAVGLFWGMFFIEVIALVAAVLGALAGVRSEAHAPELRARAARPEPSPYVPRPMTPQPT
jgi:hypothetical protein